MVISLTGGVGSGKSEVLKILREDWDAYVLQADELAHRLYRKKQPGWLAVRRICGKKALGKDEVDRKTLARMLFADEALREKINEAVHPMVYAKVYGLIGSYLKAHPHGLAVYESALNPELRLSAFDYVVHVTAPEEVRVSRLKDYRGYDEARIRSVMASQLPEERYRSAADYTIENDCSREELRRRVAAVMKEMKKHETS